MITFFLFLAVDSEYNFSTLVHFLIIVIGDERDFDFPHFLSTNNNFFVVISLFNCVVMGLKGTLTVFCHCICYQNNLLTYFISKTE